MTINVSSPEIEYRQSSFPALCSICGRPAARRETSEAAKRVRHRKDPQSASTQIFSSETWESPYGSEQRTMTHV
ncbi:hypothetical protein BC835DRAFT_562288 [Cytidiella melzeri]|nr:hypothetical protein BC835DRAFT_562288 [Cytidiella melzeri]